MKAAPQWWRRLSPRWREPARALQPVDAPQVSSQITNEGDGKAFSTARARFALKGWALIPNGTGGYLASRWGRSVDLQTLDDANALLQRIGGVT